MSLLYIFFISTYPFYRSRYLYKHELVNELLLMLILYHLALLSNVSWGIRIKQVLNFSVIGTTALMLLGNGCLMILANLKGYCKARKLRIIKAQRDAVKMERDSALGVLQCAGVLNEILDGEISKIDLRAIYLVLEEQKTKVTDVT